MKKLSKVLYVILFFVLAYFIYAGVGFVSNLKSQEKNAVSLIEKNVPGLVSSWTYSKAFFDAVRVKEADFVRNYPYLIQNVGSCSLEGKPVCDARYEKNFGSKAKNDVLCQVKLKCEKIKMFLLKLTLILSHGKPYISICVYQKLRNKPRLFLL